MNNPLISVIVPVYNVEQYLNRCVESIVSQSYKNLEIILVDDGSPDNCPKMCDEWAEKDGRIKVIHKENGGLSDARNVGITASCGELITLVDSDDYIHPDMIQKLLNRMIRDNSDIALCNYELVGNWDFSKEYPIKDEVLTCDEALDKLVEYYYWHYEIACAKLYKRYLFDFVKFPEGKLHEDVFTAHLFFSNCNKISCVSGALYYYVKNDESIVHSYSIRRFDLVEALFQRFDFFYERSEYKAASKCLFRAVEKHVQICQNLDTEENGNKKTINHYKKEYYVRYKQILDKNIPFKNKLRLTAFIFGCFAYITTSKIIGKF